MLNTTIHDPITTSDLQLDYHRQALLAGEHFNPLRSALDTALDLLHNHSALRHGLPITAHLSLSPELTTLNLRLQFATTDAFTDLKLFFDLLMSKLDEQLSEPVRLETYDYSYTPTRMYRLLWPEAGFTVALEVCLPPEGTETCKVTKRKVEQKAFSYEALELKCER